MGTMGAVEGVFRPPWQEQCAYQRGVRENGKGDTKQRRSHGYAEKSTGNLQAGD